MKYKITNYLALGFLLIGLSACQGESNDINSAGQSSSAGYDLNIGWYGEQTAYAGRHPKDFSSEVSLTELDGGVQIQIVLDNTIADKAYRVVLHRQVNSTDIGGALELDGRRILDESLMGNGGRLKWTTTLEGFSYFDIHTRSTGLFVVHDPLQAYSETDFSSFLSVGGWMNGSRFDFPQYRDSCQSFGFNRGQVADRYAYAGGHPDNLTADVCIETLAMFRLESRISLALQNTISGLPYKVGVYRSADSSASPNGIPYALPALEEVLLEVVPGNGGTVWYTKTINQSLSELEASTEAYLIVHDPTQPIDPSDPSRALIFEKLKIF